MSNISMEKTKCTCSLCQKGNYNPEDFYVDMSFLKKERPVGVSGLLRVKNDAEFLSDCIDSCIDALDELIICYQDCEDNAPEIILEKQRKYPDKIKVYHYAPPVYCHGLTEEEREFAFSLPDSSIHKLCNYYNYTLSKATYCYAVKIDSDQIYFANKLKRYCDAFRLEDQVKLCMKDYFVKYYYKAYRRIMSKFIFPFPFDLFSLIPMTREWIMRKYEDYLTKEIINNKYTLSLSGINLGFESGKWGIYMLNERPFNGETDHLIFRITKDTFYTTFMERKEPIEIMKYNKIILPGGWFWYHLQGVRKSSNHTKKEWLVLTSRLKPIRTCSNWSRFNRVLWLFFWAYDRNFPDPYQLLSETTFHLRNRR